MAYDFVFTPREEEDYRIRVVVEGTAASGRDVLRGVMAWARARRNWKVHVEMSLLRPKKRDWLRDEAVIYASHYEPLLLTLLERRLPIVSCTAHHEHLGLPTVRSDDLAIGQQAAKYFLERGFQRFVFEDAGDSSLAAELRWQGLCQTVEAEGFSAIRHTFVSESNDIIDRFESLGELLRKMPKPVALMFSHDTLARSMSDYLATPDLIVPAQVAILGVDNDVLQCEIARPPLSSISIPYVELGRRAAEVLHELLRGELSVKLPLLIPPGQIITRESSDIVAFDEPRLAEALRYMRQHACDPCAVEDVLQHVVVSRRWLESQFRKRFGRSPHEEITRVRMERARHLLHDATMPLKTVAERSGYSHVQNFVAVFRRTVGQTPAAFRRSVRQAGLQKV